MTSPRSRHEARRRHTGWRLFAAAVAAGLLGQAVVRTAPPAQHYFDWSRLQFRPAEYRARRDRLAADLGEHGGGVFLAPARLGRAGVSTFRQLDDFLYFTGLELPDAILAIDADDGRTIVFAPAQDARFFEPRRRNDFPGRPLQADPELARRSGIDEIRPIGEFEAALDGWIAAHRPLRVDAGAPGALESLGLHPIQDWGPLQHFIAYLQRSHPSASLENAYASIARLRMVKSPAEVAVMRRAAALTARGIAAASARVRAGVDERGLEAAFEGACKEGGAQRLAFASIVKSGPNALWPWRILAAQYDRRNRTMHAGELVIFDVGCELDAYSSDVGRTFPVSGRFSDRQRRTLAMEVAVSDAVIDAIRPGVTLAALQQIAARTIPPAERLYMQTGLYFGHHIGLSVEDPFLAEAPLAPGMVITIEPWYYNHDLGLSVFTEDDILVTPGGAENLTATLPRTPEGLERLMRTGRIQP